jgi:HAMP domain-containing protein
MTAPVLAAIAYADTLKQNLIKLRQAAAHLEQYRLRGETTIEAAARIMADELRKQNK